MTFSISERPERILYQDYAVALHAKMKARENVKRISSHDRRHFSAQHEYICATTAVLLVECDLIDAINRNQ